MQIILHGNLPNSLKTAMPVVFLWTPINCLRNLRHSFRLLGIGKLFQAPAFGFQSKYSWT